MTVERGEVRLGRRRGMTPRVCAAALLGLGVGGGCVHPSQRPPAGPGSAPRSIGPADEVVPGRQTSWVEPKRTGATPPTAIAGRTPAHASGASALANAAVAPSLDTVTLKAMEPAVFLTANDGRTPTGLSAAAWGPPVPAPSAVMVSAKPRMPEVPTRSEPAQTHPADSGDPVLLASREARIAPPKPRTGQLLRATPVVVAGRESRIAPPKVSPSETAATSPELESLIIASREAKIAPPLVRGKAKSAKTSPEVIAARSVAQSATSGNAPVSASPNGPHSPPAAAAEAMLAASPNEANRTTPGVAEVAREAATRPALNEPNSLDPLTVEPPKTVTASASPPESAGPAIDTSLQVPTGEVLAQVAPSPVAAPEVAPITPTSEPTKSEPAVLPVALTTPTPSLAQAHPDVSPGVRAVDLPDLTSVPVPASGLELAAELPPAAVPSESAIPMPSPSATAEFLLDAASRATSIPLPTPVDDLTQAETAVDTILEAASRSTQIPMPAAPAADPPVESMPIPMPTPIPMPNGSPEAVLEAASRATKIPTPVRPPSE